MTHSPNSSAAPPGPGAPVLPAVPPQPSAPVRPHAPAAPVPAPPRRTAFAEGAERLRAAAVTEPGRLRLIGALLALLVVAFGAVAAWQSTDRQSAADDVLHHSQPLSSEAAAIFRSLADANTMASSGYLAGLQETRATRERYEADIRTAAQGLVTAAANSAPGSPSAKTIGDLNELLPRYKGLVESARANNRQGFPVGGAYLRAANTMMQDRMLPAAETLYRTENRQRSADYGDATPYPWAAIALGVLALAALGWAQHRDYRRTNRVLNQGLVAAAAATAAVLLWLVVGHSVARAGLDDSRHGVESLNVLHDARIASLKARGDENLTLVSRGAETRTLADGTVMDAYDWKYDQEIGGLARTLARAESLADDPAGRDPVRAASQSVKVWKSRHALAREADDAGDYRAARDRVIGTGATAQATGECFDGVDASLATALAHETQEFESAAKDGLAAMSYLPAGSAVLALLGAAGALLGIGRRLSEYR
ncbi:hypothetical protein [Streptomyces sp. NRRL S-340]|uniref:hypothetical protein n=1 Tax=Streptomyces sp. NRRL S-340 TaxID=1463901 RepID=UPI00055CB12D|nr:hypothetical protein [Streptomyces sp. NRRL S-340]